MKYSILLPVALLTLSLSACDKPAALSPAALVSIPVPGPVNPGSGTGLTGTLTTTTPGIPTDPSLPAAASVPSAASPIAPQGKTNPLGAMTKQEESTSMPKPGQAGDHSTPALQPQK